MNQDIREKIPMIAVVSLVGGLLLFAYAHQSAPRNSIARAAQRAKLVFTRLPKADIMLPVKFDKQDHSLSCEVATLKMALAYKGTAVEESTLIGKIGVDPVAKQTVNGKLVWGDPQKAFVGDINGRMPSTGYGVYWDPIERVGAEYRPTRSISGSSIAELVEELQRGNPIIIWGHLGSGKPFTWQTPENKTIPAVYYEHTFLVNGIKGSVKNPEGFFLIDPIYGQLYWPLAKFKQHWASLGNSGVVVY
jgi:uncharacterized protein YvpB